MSKQQQHKSVAEQQMKQHQQLMQQQQLRIREREYRQKMLAMWRNQFATVTSTDYEEFRHHELPLARIKKIMKSDEEVKMISAEAPVLFSKACELFVLDITTRAWMHTLHGKRRTLQRNDVAAAVHTSELFDFLTDVVEEEHMVAAQPTKDPADKFVVDTGHSTSNSKNGRPVPSASTIASSRNSKLFQKRLVHQERKRHLRTGAPTANSLGHNSAALAAMNIIADAQRHHRKNSKNDNDSSNDNTNNSGSSKMDEDGDGDDNN
eukprot:TRINITY_DN53460_c0_g1_i1.p1 TRINITY_DN53460_c0_g1~~TRINITY_DN53460_c0_g1_i1.p1  ORF type:complete len:283 (+),score=145.05 TRINITY_DN53460_c0_g1_i1:58-849(+)